eukprot:scaffold1684_cov214-Amphora_coffeaeformis.AAC.18
MAFPFQIPRLISAEKAFLQVLEGVCNLKIPADADLQHVLGLIPLTASRTEEEEEKNHQE